jgi:hypothetical protein
MKSLVRIMAAVALLFGVFAAATPANADSPNSAAVISDFACGLYDGNGGFAISDSSHSVVTSSDVSVLKCSATVAPSLSGKAVQYNDFGCNTFLGFTIDSRETVSASGQATLTCKVHL